MAALGLGAQCEPCYSLWADSSLFAAEKQQYQVVVNIKIDPSPGGPRWPPQVVLSLDENARVVGINRSLAGNRFSSISETKRQCVHSQLHPSCDGKCDFTRLWKMAWDSLDLRDGVEWEVDDPKLACVLRLNLVKPPATQQIEMERRQRHTLLTITDITKYRREYESLVVQQQALIKLLLAKDSDQIDSDTPGYDESGDTGNRLMAGYAKKQHSFGRQLVKAQESERRRIAAELHDGLAQTITVVKYNIETSMARLAKQDPDLDLSVFDGAVDDIRGMVEEIRRISSNLAPVMLEDFGTNVALAFLCKDFAARNREISASCSVCIDEDETPDLIKIATYRVVQEALNNVAKHASATRVDVSLKSSTDGLRLIIADNGAGFDVQELRNRASGRSGFGLRSMRERVEATGGTFYIKSAPGNGVVLHARWDESELDLTR